MTFITSRRYATALVAGGISLCGACIAPSLAYAQSATAPVITAAAYKIAPEDSLEVTVLDHPEVTRSVIVLEDGTIDLPYCGQVQVAGMSIADAKKRITKLLARTFVRPQVNIAVRGRQLRQVSVIGPVRTPGKLPLRDGWRVLDVIAAAGGLPGDRTEFFRATLYKDKEKRLIPLDVTKLVTEKDPAFNLPVEADDIVTISEVDTAQKIVQVVGSVGKPGPVEYPRSGSLLDVLQMAGGPAPNAALSQAFIQRGDTKIPVNLLNYQQKGFEIKEQLQPGDQIFIPENKDRINFLGAVGRAGELPYPEDRKLTAYSAIAYSGGQTINAELKKVRVTKHKPDGTTTSQIVNVEKMLKTGDLSGDIPVEPGDDVYVPGSPGRRGLGAFEVLGIIGVIPTLYGLFTGKLFR